MADPDVLPAIARRLYGEELRGDSLNDHADALRSATTRLINGLAPILGATGTRLILTRALRRSARHSPFLARVAIFDEGVEAENAIRGLSSDEAPLVRTGFEGLLEEFFATLASLVGPELTALLAREALTRRAGGRRPMEDEDNGP
jgi:hypothetical protein